MDPLHLHGILSDEYMALMLQSTIYNEQYIQVDPTYLPATPQIQANVGYAPMAHWAAEENSQVRQPSLSDLEGFQHFDNVPSPDSNNGLTPLTPRSSEESVPGRRDHRRQPGGLPIGHRSLAPRGHNPIRDISLDGLAQSQSRISRPFTVHSDVIGPPLGSLSRSPHQLIPSGVRNEPWNGIQFRHEDRSQATRHQEVTAVPDLEINFEDPASHQKHLPIRPAMRDGPFEDEKRLKINKVRTSGACIRCKLYREPCDEKLPCQKCRKIQNNLRKWKLSCTRLGIKDRFYYLEHSRIREQHGPDAYNDLVTSNSYDFDYSKRPIFLLELWLGTYSQKFADNRISSS